MKTVSRNIPLLRQAVSGAAALFGVRVVNVNWGPQGFAAAFRRLRDSGFAPKSIIDVGASNGTWTQECLPIFPDARYLLIDPLPGNRASLEELSRDEPAVDYWSGAVGGTSEEITFYEHGDQSSALRSSSFPGAAIRVEQRPLDKIAAERQIEGPCLIKVDVQGLELAVLHGAEDVLRDTEILLIELSILEVYEGAPLAHEVIGFLASRGFQIMDFCSYSQRPLDGGLAQVDALFVKMGSSLVSKKGWN